MTARKILFIAPSAYVLSGLATWLDFLDPGLRARGWDVVIGLVEGPRHHRPETYLEVHPHVNWVAIPCMTGTVEGRRRAIERTISDIRPDLVVSVNIPDAYTAIARIRAKGLAAPKVVMTVHGIEAWLYDDIRQYRPWLDGIICSNRLACHLASTQGDADPQRVHYAPYGVAGQPCRDDLFSQKRLRIAYVGRLEQWQKRINIVPHVLDQLSAMDVPFQLLIAGDGPAEVSLRQRLASRCENEEVAFLGRLSPDEVRRQVYEVADVLFMPPFWETGPIVIWEAMAYGMPVVASRYIGSGLEGALEHEGNALLFGIDDARDAAEQLARLWRNPALGHQLGEKGRQLVDEHYSIPASVSSWEKAFQTVLDSPPRHGMECPPAPQSSGRLDQWLGCQRAETLRGLLGRRAASVEPGGEWPHSYSGVPLDDQTFWREAQRSDSKANSEGGV